MTITNNEISETIVSWFKTVAAVGLILPDGWFGRPYDNYHRLTYLEVRPHKLLVELDNQLLLIFTDLASAELKGQDLALSGFVQCAFDWQEYGTLAPHLQGYSSGQVTFTPAPSYAQHQPHSKAEDW